MNDYIFAIKIDSTNALAYYNIANLQQQKNETENAIINYTKCIKFDYYYKKAYMARAELYYKKGEKQEACEDYKMAERLGDGAAISKRILTCN